MTPIETLIVVTLFGTFVYALFFRGPSQQALVKKSIEENNLSALLGKARALPEKQRSIFYQQSIEQLWNGYHRELAAEVIKDFAKHNPEEKICQFWIQQLLECEKRLAREVLEEDFLANYYNPEVASCCGVTGS